MFANKVFLCKIYSMDEIFVGFEPLIFDDTEVLILGSFPSVMSRADGFYYGNPQNRFWKVLASIFDEKPPVSRESKVEFCRKHKIGLWDVVWKAKIIGSSDSNLSKTIVELADVGKLLKEHPRITKVLCNGTLAYKIYSKHCAVGIDCVLMPSTSPANVRFDVKVWERELAPK